MTKATHFGGSSLEYKPIRPTDYLTSLKPIYDEDTRILKQQHTYLRERDQQMVARAKQQDDFFIALGQFAPTMIEYAKHMRKKNQAKLDEGSKDDIWGPDWGGRCEPGKDCPGDPGFNPDDPKWGGQIFPEDKPQPTVPPKPGEKTKPPAEDDTQEVKNYRQGLEALSSEAAHMAKLLASANVNINNLGPVMRDKILNSTGAQRLSYQRVLLAATVQGATPQAFEKYTKDNLRFHEWLSRIKNPIDRDQAYNQAYQTWISTLVKPFNPSEGMMKTIVRPEIARLTQTKTNKTYQSAVQYVHTEEHTRIAGQLETFGRVPGEEGASQVASGFISLAQQALGIHKFQDKEGYTAMQQARDHVAKHLVDLIHAPNSNINQDVLNKMFEGIINHAAGDTVAKAILDKEGVVYNHLTNEVRKAGLARFALKQSQEKENQQIFLSDIANKTEIQLNEELDRLRDLPWKDKTLFDKLESYSNQYHTQTQINQKRADYLRTEENGLLLDPAIQDRIKNEKEPTIKKEMEDKTKIVNERLGATNYDEVRKLATMLIENVGGAAKFPGSNKLPNTEQAVDRFMAIWGRNVNKTIKGLTQPDGSVGFAPNIGMNAYKDTVAFYESQGGGNTDPRTCVGMFCFHPSLGYTKLNEIEKVEALAEETANLPYEVIVEDTLKQNAKIMKPLLKEHKSHENISKKVAGAYASNTEMLGMLLTGKFSDKFLLQAKYAQMEPNKLFENCLSALVKADPEFAKLHNLTHTLKEVEALNKNEAALTTRIMRTLDNDTSVEALDIKYAVTVTGWDNATPKAKSRYLEYMNKSAGSRKNQIQEKFNTTDVGKARLRLEEAERLQTIGTREEQVDMKKVKEYQNEMKQEDKQKEIFNPYIAQNTKNQEDKQLSFNLTEGVRIAKTFIDEVNNLT